MQVKEVKEAKKEATLGGGVTIQVKVGDTDISLSRLLAICNKHVLKCPEFKRELTN
jgi:flagellar motor switch/type III secretory pathway protein FliN